MDVAAALAAGTPLPLLGLASSMLAMFEPRPSFARPAEPGPPVREELFDSFFAVENPETSALPALLAGLSGDDVLRHRVRREIATRGHALPRWLLDLDQAQPASTGYAYGDGHVGSPDYLTGAHRAGMVADRDRLRA
jgi:hypothetical protein